MILKEIEDQIIMLARKNNIEAVYRGYDPEESSREIYWLIKPGKYDENLEKKMTDLEIRLTRAAKSNISITLFPISRGEANKYPFLNRRIYNS